ncbi:MAG: TetR/AcrR family transcriptional regulator [Clostridiales bacterium]|nr:TetR/AcrR family transcriptional regulator [Clostridiales bacterium]
MPVDMKHTIAKATETLLIDKKVVKLTVKDIVEECHITRQAFYYHFANIPELLDWIISQREEELLENLTDADTDTEPAKDRIRYWSLIILNATDHLKKLGKSAYRKEIEEICFSHLEKYFFHIAQKNDDFSALDTFDQELIIRYHCYALAGILRDWDPKNSIEELDRTLYDIYVIISGEFWRLTKSDSDSPTE